MKSPYVVLSTSGGGINVPQRTAVVLISYWAWPRGPSIRQESDVTFAVSRSRTRSCRLSIRCSARSITSLRKLMAARIVPTIGPRLTGSAIRSGAQQKSLKLSGRPAYSRSNPRSEPVPTCSAHRIAGGQGVDLFPGIRHEWVMNPSRPPDAFQDCSLGWGPPKLPAAPICNRSSAHAGAT